MVGISGGVDSAVAALLLLEHGWQLRGLFMKNWEEDDTQAYCSAAEDLADARAVAGCLGIPLETVNFSAEYWDRVFSHFLAEYRAGRTPNPDVLCNREIKFRAFLDHALASGAAGIATGHYARISGESGGWHLRRACDEDKDQSYFLHQLDQGQLARSHFPLGELTKPQVRARAQAAGLPNHDKKDSTGICFIGERRFRDFLRRFLPARPGPVVTAAGQLVGEHQGLMYYTLGQRRGLGLGGMAGGEEAPWFVIAKDLEHNRLIVAQDHDHPWLLSTVLSASRLHWVAGTPPSMDSLECTARIRHRQPLERCKVQLLAQACCRVEFARPQRAITPGQSVVFYQGDDCLGGGVIESAGNRT